MISGGRRAAKGDRGGRVNVGGSRGRGWWEVGGRQWARSDGGGVGERVGRPSERGVRGSKPPGKRKEGVYVNKSIHIYIYL